MLRSKSLQAKLTISQPNDEYEQEADRVAATVMRMENVARQSIGQADEPPAIQRMCAECEEETEEPPMVQRMCNECEDEVQRKESGAEVLSNNFSYLPGTGQVLPDSDRDFFESRFGRDFSSVRIHTDSQAAGAAQSLNAVAFTHRSNIAFAPGQYAPHTSSGRSLLAHELTHVVQQVQPARRMDTTADGPHVSAVANEFSEMPVQRLVRRSLLVGCGPGQNPFRADRRAAELLTNALARIDAAVAARPGDPANADVVAVGDAMHTAFRLDEANDDNWNLAAPHFGLPLIRRRLEAARDYITSVVFTFNCCTVGGACAATCGTCAAGEEAFVCRGETSTITLCPLFFTRNPNQRGRVLAHEVLHITFGHITDWDQPDRANAHCYAQFTALVNGFNSPAGFRCH